MKKITMITIFPILFACLTAQAQEGPRLPIRGDDIDPADHGVKYFPARIQGESSEERIASFIEGLKKLEPGETYMFVEHPAFAGPEMEAIEELGIVLISHADLVR